MKKKERGDATRPWSRRAMSVSARARGHLDVARVTEQQQGMADEVVFTLVLSISLDGTSLAFAKVGLFDRLKYSNCPLAFSWESVASQVQSECCLSKASRWRESGNRGSRKHSGGEKAANGRQCLVGTYAFLPHLPLWEKFMWLYVVIRENPRRKVSDRMLVALSSSSTFFQFPS